MNQSVLDANGEQIKIGATVVDVMFGEGVARGTAPLGRSRAPLHASAPQALHLGETLQRGLDESKRALDLVGVFCFATRLVISNASQPLIPLRCARDGRARRRVFPNCFVNSARSDIKIEAGGPLIIQIPLPTLQFSG